MKDLFEQFLKEKEYLKSVLKKTLIFYKESMKAYISPRPGSSFRFSADWLIETALLATTL